jgi:predicted RNA binding protein YcfA (HicA-like mRNA interferase family)
MPKLKRLSGMDIVAILAEFGFTVAGQKGSHIKLRRVHAGTRQTLTIPRHKELDRGTTAAIFKQAARYVSEDALRPHFFTG